MFRDHVPKAHRSRRQWLKAALGALMTPTVLDSWAESGEIRKIPQLDIELLDGSSILAKQLQGKVVAYLFWATWCPVCTGELPVYEQLRIRYRSKGLEVLAISLDQAPETVAIFKNQHDYELPVGMRSDAIRQAFGPIKGTPTLFLVDRHGVLRFKHLGGIDPSELEKQIKSIL